MDCSSTIQIHLVYRLEQETVDWFIIRENDTGHFGQEPAKLVWLGLIFSLMIENEAMMTENNTASDFVVNCTILAILITNSCSTS